MLIQHLFSKPRTHVMSSLFYAVLLEKWWKIRGQIPVKLPITTNGRVHFFFSFFFCCQLSLPAQKHEFYNPQCNESSMSAWILLFSPRAPARLCWYSSHVSCWCCSFEVCVCVCIHICMYMCVCVSFYCRGAPDEGELPSFGHHSNTGGKQSIATRLCRLKLISQWSPPGIYRCCFPPSADL